MTKNKMYENPAATVDLILSRGEDILLIKRGGEIFNGYWALPGGFLDCGKESLEEAGARELREETGLVVATSDLSLVGVYSDPNRDPRGHVVSHSYYAKSFEGELKAGDDAKEARWWRLDDLPNLAFDHEKIICDYMVDRIKLKGNFHNF